MQEISLVHAWKDFGVEIKKGRTNMLYNKMLFVSVIFVFTIATPSQTAIKSAHFRHTKVLEKTIDGKIVANKFESEVYIKGEKIRQVTKAKDFEYILFFNDGYFYTYYTNRDTVNRYADRKYFNESGKEMKEKFIGKPVPFGTVLIDSEDTPEGRCGIYEYGTEKTEKAIKGTVKKEISKIKEWRRNPDLFIVKTVRKEIKQEISLDGVTKEQKEITALTNSEIETNINIPESMFKIPANLKILDK